VLEINLKAGLVKVRWLHATTPDTIS